MNLAAFDPGLSGAVVIAKRAYPWFVMDLPTVGDGSQTVLNGVVIARLLKSSKVTCAVVERVHAFPGQGVSSMFRFGTAYGQIIGVLQALGIPYELVAPAKWKRAMMLPGGAGAEKSDAVRRAALALHPALADSLTRKKDHNRAEAILLAHWSLYGGAR